jgi:hypothetical protein
MMATALSFVQAESALRSVYSSSRSCGELLLPCFSSTVLLLLWVGTMMAGTSAAISLQQEGFVTDALQPPAALEATHGALQGRWGDVSLLPYRASQPGTLLSKPELPDTTTGTKWRERWRLGQSSAGSVK